MDTNSSIAIIGGGLAGSEAALTLADLGFEVHLFEMRPKTPTPVHHSGSLAELVCSNSLKSTKPDSAAGMLKHELDVLGSRLYSIAKQTSVAAGGALAVDREVFSECVTDAVETHPNITLFRKEVTFLEDIATDHAAIILATGPLTSDALAREIVSLTGKDALAFFDAAAPIVMADSIDRNKVFSQSRYEFDEVEGDYLNAPFTKEEYDAFIEALVKAERVIAKDFEATDLFQACQPIEEIARKGKDAPRYGTMKPVGLVDPKTGKRPWACLQLRREDRAGCSYNLVGFQTNLTFPEQRRAFRMIPGLENAEFARYGVMHRNTYIDSPRCIDIFGKMNTPAALTLEKPIYVAGQLGGTEGYCEAIRSGLHVAFALAAEVRDTGRIELPAETAFGALMTYASDPQTKNYQPMHVNFGIMPPLAEHIRNKRARYEAYANRGGEALSRYADSLRDIGLLSRNPKEA